MTTPSLPGPVPTPNDEVKHAIAAIEQRLRESDRKTLYSASIGAGGLTISDDGAIRVLDDNDVERVFIGSTNGFEAFDQPVVFFRDALGKLRFGIFDPAPVGDGYQPVVWTFDHLDHVAFTTDKNGGVAEPWIPVTLTPRWAMAAGLYPYRSLDATLIATEKQLWEGMIGKVSHPRIQIHGVWGQGSGSNSTTYRLLVNSVQVGTWTVGGGLSVSTRGPYDISSLVSSSTVSVELMAAATGTGAVACDVISCHLRQS